MTIANITSSKTQIKRHQTVAKKYETVALEVHMLACEDLIHARNHGDTSLCKHLFNTLGGADKSKSFSHTRVEALKVWFAKMSGGQMTAEGEEWKFKKGWTADKFLSEEEMERTPYWTLVPEKSHENMSWETILKMLTGIPKRIDKEVAADKFNGNPEAVKAIVNGVIDFATERAKKLSAQDLGVVSNKADAILKQGTSNTPDMSEGPQQEQAVG